MTDLTGQHFGQYVITAKLGQGGMASVYRAHQSSMGRDVAIKVINPDLAENTEYVARFMREVRTVATLSHQHILKVFDFGKQDKLLYLVMELMPGGTLADQISRGPLPFQQIAAYLEQIGSALDYAHSNGVIHRDLKPHNILLDASGNAWLTDFGLARSAYPQDSTGLTQLGIAMGTPQYMAPEQWRQDGRVDSRSDLYAFGIILYEMLTGNLPFPGKTPYQLMHAHNYEPPPPVTLYRPGIPAETVSVLQKALAKRPDDRYQTGAELAAAFRHAISFDPFGPRMASVPSRITAAAPTWEPSDGESETAVVSVAEYSLGHRRQRLLYSAGIAVALLAVFALVILFLVARNPGDNALVSDGSPALPATTAGPMLAGAQSILITITSTSSPTPTASSTLTSSPTPSPSPWTALTETQIAAKVATQVAAAQAGTAGALAALLPTLTPSLSPTPVLSPTPSPDLMLAATQLEETVAARLAAVATATAEALARVSPTATTDVEGTIAALVALTDTAEALIPTATETDQPTSTVSPTLALSSPTPLPTSTALPIVSIATSTVMEASPTGKIAFRHTVAGRRQIGVVRPDRSGLRIITDGRFFYDYPSWSWDGTQLVVSARRDLPAAQIYTMNADGSNLRLWTRHANNCWQAAWSPDGKTIVYHSNVRTGTNLFELYVLDRATGESRLFWPDSLSFRVNGVYSPDGRHIVFNGVRPELERQYGRNTNRGSGLFIANADGSNMRALTSPDVNGFTPAWSPDGQWIAYTSTRSGKLGIYLIRSDGTEDRPVVVRSTDDNERPAWSPDSRYLVFQSNRDGVWKLYIVRTDGSDERRVTNTDNTVEERSPDWGP